MPWSIPGAYHRDKARWELSNLSQALLPVLSGFSLSHPVLKTGATTALACKESHLSNKTGISVILLTKVRFLKSH